MEVFEGFITRKT